MNRRESIGSAAAAGVAAAVRLRARGGEERGTSMPPNLLFLYTDEQRTDTLACHGNGRGIMPNIDRLAAQATVFDRAYCTQPVCTPARGSIVTGLYSHAHGAVDNNTWLRRDAKCLPEHLPAGLYTAGHFGKWHLGDEIFPQHGFTDWRGTEDTYHCTYSPPVKEFGPERSHYHHWLLKHGVKPNTPGNMKPGDPKWHPAYENRFFRDQIHLLPEEVSRPAFLAEQALEFIRDNKARPWALYINFLEPHPPFHSCRDKQYSPADVTLAPNWKEELGPDRPLRLRARAASEREEEKRLRETTARYWGMCSLLDDQIARIMKALDDYGLRGSTIIAFTTDHGEMLGSYGLGGKGCMFDEAAHVPMFVSLPGQKTGRRVGRPVSQIDLVPTLLDLMGQKIPPGLHGSSLAPVMTGPKTEPDRDVFIQWETGPVKHPKPAKMNARLQKLGTADQIGTAYQERVRTVVTRDGWKFNRNSLGLHELYDLNNDPMERQNLAGDSAQKDRVSDLQGKIATWQAGVEDRG
jgi:arylsulfatase A-like enzyme